MREKQQTLGKDLMRYVEHAAQEAGRMGIDPEEHRKNLIQMFVLKMMADSTREEKRRKQIRGKKLAHRAAAVFA